MTVNPISGGGHSDSKSGRTVPAGNASAAPDVPSQITATGSIVDGTTGAKLSSFSAVVTLDSSSNAEVSLDEASVVQLKQLDGTISAVGDFSKISIAAVPGESATVSVSAGGKLQIQGLPKGSDNSFSINYYFGNGQRLTIGTMKLKIDDNGGANIISTLIDPYGRITDASTGKAVSGADVKLYYANTARNIAVGKTPDAVVQLPFINGFKPSNNANPQVSDPDGAYAFMVFPETDYYIVASKDGYDKYTSQTVSVERAIVKWNFKMNEANTQVTAGQSVPTADNTQISSAASTPSAIMISRLAGKDRVDTALEIAKASFTGKVSNIVLATCENYPDALAGSTLAYKYRAPILLVGNSASDRQRVLDYMRTNMVIDGTVYILGGYGAISKDIETQINNIGFSNIVRVGGANRYETSAKIADMIGAVPGTPIVLAYGEDYPDALSASSLAAVKQYPVLLVNKNKIPDAVGKEIAELNPSKVYIIGLQGVISSEVERETSQITSAGNTIIVRIGGSNKFETSLEVAKYFNLSGSTICIATGNDYPDALAGSIYAAKNNAPIILTDSKLSDSELTYIKSKNLRK